MTIKLNHANFWNLFMIFILFQLQFAVAYVKHTKHIVKDTILYVKHILHFFAKIFNESARYGDDVLCNSFPDKILRKICESGFL